MLWYLMKNCECWTWAIKKASLTELNFLRKYYITQTFMLPDRFYSARDYPDSLRCSVDALSHRSCIYARRGHMPVAPAVQASPSPSLSTFPRSYSIFNRSHSTSIMKAWLAASCRRARWRATWMFAACSSTSRNLARKVLGTSAGSGRLIPKPKRLTASSRCLKL
jgi:hypothetical protein